MNFMALAAQKPVTTLRQIAIALSLLSQSPRCVYGLEADSNDRKWEAGAGFGSLSFEHYPGSDQVTKLSFPLPTFQYRGEILRADEKDGAKLLLLKRPEWVTQVGGTALPPLDSSTNTIRKGMLNLPLLAAVGPQVEFSPFWGKTNVVGSTITSAISSHLKFGLYPAASAQAGALQLNGALWEADLSFKFFSALSKTTFPFTLDELVTVVSFTWIGASREVHGLYYDVDEQSASALRPRFHAHAGLLHSQINIFQAARRDNLAFFIGARISDYGSSANRESPLMQANQSAAALIGLSYTFYQSSARAVPYENAKGMIDKVRSNLK
jgi:outer membrane scaffolding protein for murein synthesis (MipA/OmpV family)